MKNKTGKRILEVKIRRMLDDSPDTSYLGEYSNSAESEYSIDRAHAHDCASQAYNGVGAIKMLERILGHVQSLHDAATTADEVEAMDAAYDVVDQAKEDVRDCDCGDGNLGRGQYQYFNPNVGNYEGEAPEDIRKYCAQDYERMESLSRGDWSYIGVRAVAEIGIGDVANFPKHFDVTTQTITSGGLGGIESDSDSSYFETVKAEQLVELKEQLRALGFSARAIATAFKNVKEEDA
jgi:hypothetical protein